jgi:hypothetical protein
MLRALQVEGRTNRIEQFFADLAPEPQRGKAMPEGMINALLRIDSSDTVKGLGFINVKGLSIGFRVCQCSPSYRLERHCEGVWGGEGLGFRV